MLGAAAAEDDGDPGLARPGHIGDLLMPASSRVRPPAAVEASAGREVGDEVGGVLDAAGEPHEARRRRRPRPTGPAGRRAVHAAEAGRRRHSRLREQPAHRRPVGAARRDARRRPQHLPRGERERRVPGRHGQRTPSPPGGRPAPRRPRPRSPPAGPAAGPACSSTGAPSHASNGPGVLPVLFRHAAAGRTGRRRSVLTCPSSRSLCPVSALVSLPTVRSAPSSSGRCPSGVAVVLSTATTAPAARVRPARRRRCRRRRAAGCSASPAAPAGRRPGRRGRRPPRSPASARTRTRTPRRASSSRASSRVV